MTTFSKIIYIIMLTSIFINMGFDAHNGLFDMWKFNTLCWVVIAFMLEVRAIRAEKEINENNKYH